MNRGETLRLFEKLLELPEGEREAFLESVPDERFELTALLEKEREGSAFPGIAVPTSAFEELGLAAFELSAGTRIGSFRIERLIGSGGMGRVHLAEQDNPSRKVAIKTLKHGFNSEEAFQRFRIEGELLGRLRHPGIAQVFETGVQRLTTESGSVEMPYIAMELLDGARSIVEYAKEKELDLDDRLRLVVSASRAVHHAHQKGVIHRDIKPANVVVDGDGRARVIDFGAARAAELEQGHRAVQTQAGNILGTPAYMSPEQLTLPSEELDIRVDVYALGAVLYEMVCGRAPFETDGVPIAVLAKLITEQGLTRPRALVRSLPQDLEAILLTALARNRDERYSSAAAFSDDLERYLNHQTIEARRPSMLHQVGLFARRNRLFTASILIASISLVASAITSANFARKERLARLDADAYLKQALDSNFQLAFDYADAISSMEGSLELRVGMLRSALAKLGELETEAQRDPSSLASLARAYVKLGNALGAMDQASLGDAAGAAMAYDKAVSLLDGLDENEPALRLTFMEVEEALGERAKSNRDLEGMLAHFEKALEHGAAALAADPENDDLRETLAKKQRDVGNSYGSMQDHERALGLFEEAFRGLSDLVRRHPNDTTMRYNHASTLAGIATATSHSVGPLDSLPLFREALSLQEGLSEDFPGYRPASDSLVGMRHAFTEVLIKAEQEDEAIFECERGLAMADRSLADSPGNHQMRRWRGLLLYNLGWAYQQRADGDADLRMSKTVLEACRDLFLAFRNEGRITPFEETFFPVIQARIDDLTLAIDSSE